MVLPESLANLMNARVNSQGLLNEILSIATYYYQKKRLSPVYESVDMFLS